MKRPTREKQHCHGVHICLVGANLFQNEMFIATLKQAYQCQNTFTVAASLSEIPEDICNKTDHEVLFYLDCFGLRDRELENLLDSSFQIIQTGHLLALFNLAKDSGIEKNAGLTKCKPVRLAGVADGIGESAPRQMRY